MADILAKIPLEGQPASWSAALKAAPISLQALLGRLNLRLEQLPEALQAAAEFPVRVPERYLQLIETGNPHDPLLLQVLPQAIEMQEAEGYSTDPLQEQQAAVPGLLHKYRSRVLLVTTSACAIHCRYCFRRHFPYGDNRPGNKGLDAIVEYLRAHPEVNEVILSGGDPLSAPDSYLTDLHQRLSALPQLKRLRIHTRFPMVIPERFTETLLNVLSDPRFQTILVLHNNHPRELVDELAAPLQRLRAAGVTLLNQSVLLAGVNDNAETLTALSERLFALGVLPYYLHQLDKVRGAAHFAVSDERARELMVELLAALPGFLVPKLTREVAEKASKIPLDLRLDTL